jgi:PQQ-like domain
MTVARAWKQLRLGRIMSGTLLIAAVIFVACGSGSTGASPGVAARAPAVAVRRPPDNGDWTRFDYDAQRSGVGPARTGITLANLHTLKRRRVTIDGTVDSSPIELHAIRIRGALRDVVFVTTTYGKTIALDATTGRKLWEFTPPDISAYARTAQITNATPIADPSRRHIYAASPDGLIRKLAVATGHQVRSRGWPVRVTFDPTHEKLGTALNISGNSVVVTTGGYVGDAPPYQGHVVLIDRASGRITHVWNSLCSNRHHLIDPPSSCPASDSAIWARAGAVIERNGRILVATGNAPFNGSIDWGDSVLELSPDASRLLQNWTPTNQAQLNVTDQDLGSTAPALLPPSSGLRLAVQGGKDPHLNLLNLGRLNGRGGASRRTGGELQRISSPGSSSVVTQPAVWTHTGRTYVFVANESGTAAYIFHGGRHPRLTIGPQNATPGTSPLLAGGLLYVYNDDDGAVNVSEPTTLRRLISLPAAPGHWNSPIVIRGRIIEPEGDANAHSTNGTIDIYSVR